MFRITNYYTPILIKGLFYLSSLIIIIATVIYSLEIYQSYRDETVDLNYSPDLVTVIQKAVWLNPDGFYGEETMEKVKQFQDIHGLISDGVVGALTWEEFYKQDRINSGTYYKYKSDIGVSESQLKDGDASPSFLGLVSLLILFPIFSFFLLRIVLEYYYSLFSFLQMKVQIKKNISNDDTVLSFWSFTKMITPNSLGIIYILGIIVSIIFVLLYNKSTFMIDLSIFHIFLLFICFQIIWRLSIEFYAVIFDFLTGKE